MTGQTSRLSGSCSTLAELLRARAQGVGNGTGPQRKSWDYALLYPQGDIPAALQARVTDHTLKLSYADLLRCSEQAAQALLAAGVERGSRVVLVLPTGLAWLATFFGCQLLGATPVPLVPPWALDQLLMQAQRIARVIEVCEASVIVGELRLLAAVDALLSSPNERAGRSELRKIRRVAPSELFVAQAESNGLAPVVVEPDEPAFIQFTSGSTAEPKGVVISQRAALANCEFIGSRIGVGEEDVGCSWLPLFHDMGLIGHVLVPLLFGTQSVLLPPEVFARQPRAWLDAVTKYRASVITAPNSAYDVCTSKIAERDLASLELSSVRAALCGAEPILATTLRRFSERFATVGFGAQRFLPVYGLAEATLAVTLASCAHGPRIERFDRAALETQGRAAIDTGVDGASIELVGVGQPRSPEDLRIVDDRGRELPERQVGSIEVGGSSLMTGYFGNPAATESALHAGFVRTEDLGFVSDGELFVVGRSKEMIIKGGRNLYPYDIEAAASAVAGVRAGRVVAFGVRNPVAGTEDLTVVCETKLPHSRHKELQRAITAAVFQATGVRIDLLHLVAPGVLLKTSSGKLRRNAVRESLENGTLRKVRVPWSLRVRAVLAAGFPWLMRSREERRG